MASQVTHIIYAKKYFERVESGGLPEGNSFKLNKDEFILGCVFPDIRRIDSSVKRKDTHLKFPNVDLNFSGLTSFEAGWKFHLYCDMRREEVLNLHDFYELSGTTDFYNLPAKLLEDQLVYDKYNNWEKINAYFNNPPVMELGISVSQETFALWFAILARYMEKKPDDKSLRVFLVKQPNLLDRVDEIVALVSKLRENKKVVEILARVSEEVV